MVDNWELAGAILLTSCVWNLINRVAEKLRRAEEAFTLVRLLCFTTESLQKLVVRQELTAYCCYVNRYDRMTQIDPRRSDRVDAAKLRTLLQAISPPHSIYN